MRTRIDELDHEIRELQWDIDELESELSDKEERLAELERERDAMEAIANGRGNEEAMLVNDITPEMIEEYKAKLAAERLARRMKQHVGKWPLESLKGFKWWEVPL